MPRNKPINRYEIQAVTGRGGYIRWESRRDPPHTPESLANSLEEIVKEIRHTFIDRADNFSDRIVEADAPMDATSARPSPPSAPGPWTVDLEQAYYAVGDLNDALRTQMANAVAHLKANAATEPESNGYESAITDLEAFLAIPLKKAAK
jgi:hypothetical protein